MNKNMRGIRKSEGGFTLIELLVVVLIIGILAAIAVPQYFRVVEKGKAAEALTTLDSIRGAQERYLANIGTYCTDFNSATCPGWDLQVPTLKYFEMSNASPTTAPGWSITLTRNATPTVYSNYTISYTVAPGVKPIASCTSNAACENDLMPQ